MGILVVPIIFMTLRSSGCTQTTAVLGAALITFENGLITQSRLILLDSPLVICTAFTAWAWTTFETKYHSAGPFTGSPARDPAGTPVLQDDVFSSDWWLWLALTGLGLGATVSMKWVGLFTIAWVGSLTCLQLWNLLGDLRVTPVHPQFQPLSNVRKCGSSTLSHGCYVSSSSLLDFTWPCFRFISCVLSTLEMATVS